MLRPHQCSLGAAAARVPSIYADVRYIGDVIAFGRTKTCFLIFSAGKGVYAVNLNMPIDAPPRWPGAKLAHPGLVFEHYDGGPVQANQAIAMAYVPEASTLPGGSEVESTPPGFIRGRSKTPLSNQEPGREH